MPARVCRSAETPIEREIRLAKEREDERRREQAMFTSRHTMAAVFEEKPAPVGTRLLIMSARLFLSLPVTASSMTQEIQFIGSLDTRATVTSFGRQHQG